MKAIRTRPILRAAPLALTAVLLLLGIAGLVLAQAPDYTLDWWTVDSGGPVHRTVGEYTLSSTAGQPDARVWGDGDYTLVGGFWGGGAVQYRVHLPLVLQDN